MSLCNNKGDYGGLTCEEKIIFHVYGVSKSTFYSCPAECTKKKSKELKQEPPEGFLWFTKSWHHQGKKPAVFSVCPNLGFPNLCPQEYHAHHQCLHHTVWRHSHDENLPLGLWGQYGDFQSGSCLCS